ncbi:MAG: SCO family protein [Myxococcaceae bacterium]
MTALSLSVLVLLTAAPSSSSDVDKAEPVRTERALALTVPNEALVDQDGKPVNLPKLVKGKLVAMNFVFSTCSTICSPMSAVFSRLRNELGDKVGRDVELVSITLDPVRDTPERLEKFSSMFKRNRGWTFVTGEPPKVTRALKALGGWVADKERHPPMVLVGNPATGKWVRVYGMPTPDRLIEALVEVGMDAPTQAEVH